MPKRRKLNARHQKQQQASKPKSNKSRNQDHHHHHHQKLHDQPIIPFDRHDRILLVGEGDLSFAASLVRHHGCTNVVATVLEKSEAELLDKYPHAADNIAAFTSPPEPPPPPPPPPPAAAAAAAAEAEAETKEAVSPAEGSDDDEQYSSEEEDEYDDEEDGDTEGKKKEQDAKAHHHIRNKIIYNIDATKPLPASASRPPPKRIIFNFPHVGGKSTDVNRQVRHNQSLLVDFFTRAAIPALSASDSAGRRGRGGSGGGGGGTVVVTLFEGEPYTLWNVRDLARHAGLQVERSFRFRWDAYPGYHHARTLGVVRSRRGGEEGGGGWKGEDRATRSYVFSKKGEGSARGGSSRKRRRDDADDDD
ncbi:hypothetical protein ACRE_042510 [Hapsidospora chrysogenum ATCC 11550]|uniref:25S rRNA (uridine-N(3))-methyltransferase BMT5-like domain-containing protein n=1 Tax=Hapsidospora chrysogenum (strain ATCC 11550 / CBS 779.69 / DSM 880 / IAM 14645 / JCM 23072 / IMI 49137) TaxID=857340 RepID=A0A086T6E0_HAPC1|nr:hypothetical protein ACRE_042510 [Hapsidospora chrysogenum ATCC 11550]